MAHLVNIKLNYWFLIHLFASVTCIHFDLDEEPRTEASDMWGSVTVNVESTLVIQVSANTNILVGRRM